VQARLGVTVAGLGARDARVETCLSRVARHVPRSDDGARLAPTSDGKACAADSRRPAPARGCASWGLYRPAAAFKAAALSVRSHENSGSSRPKCP
jgi:hypothetical protein